MDLRYRRLESGDRERCIALLSPDYDSQGRIQQHSADLWNRLLGLPTLNSIVLEDWDRESERRIISFGASVFVTDSFMAQARGNPQPGLWRLVDTALESDKSPVLSLDAIRLGNSGSGLSLLVLHYGEEDITDPVEKQAVRSKKPETFFFAHAGYRIKEILMETTDEEQFQFIRAAGFAPRSDYAAYYRKNPPPSGCPRTALLGLTPEEAQPGSYAGMIFSYTPPKFFFTPREQEVLIAAMTGARDEEIAAALGISFSAIKKRWIEIYHCVVTLAPLMLPEAKDGWQPTRGTEKRRHLLNYLRLHPEELRPFLAPKKSEKRVV